jgi:hypothetical protein
MMGVCQNSITSVQAELGKHDRGTNTHRSGTLVKHGHSTDRSIPIPQGALEFLKSEVGWRGVGWKPALATSSRTKAQVGKGCS